MDNLTHTLVGAAISKADAERATPLAMATLVLAADAQVEAGTDEWQILFTDARYDQVWAPGGLRGVRVRIPRSHVP